MNDKSPKSMSNLMKASHKKWRGRLKREKRRKKRQTEAKLRDEREAQNEQIDPRYEAWLEEQELEKERIQEERRRFANEQWLERERSAVIAIKKKEQREKEEKLRREETERRIKEEWEKRQELEKKEEERRIKEEEDRKKEQDKLLQEATKNENEGADSVSWTNPIAPVRYEQKGETCPFFMKTGACRFGHRCSRQHITPDDATTVLFPNMYAHFSLEHSLRDEYDTDIDLEYEDADTYKHFEKFYEDVLPEFRKHGRVVQFKVCRNYEAHLRGNVYVQMSKHEEAVGVLTAFNGRWYAGRQIGCEFSGVTHWKQAICGLYFRKKCPKGKTCNFLHVFQNPFNEFRNADLGFVEEKFRDRSDSRRSTSWYRSPERFRDRRSSRQSSERDRSMSRRRSRSRSPRDRRSYSRRRSRSPSRASVRRSRSPSTASRRRSRSPSTTSHRSKTKLTRSKSKDRNSRLDRNDAEDLRGVSRSKTCDDKPNNNDNISTKTRRSRSKSKDRDHIDRISGVSHSKTCDDNSNNKTPEYSKKTKSKSNGDENSHECSKPPRESVSRLSRSPDGRDGSDNEQSRNARSSSGSRSRSRSPSSKRKKHKKHKKGKKKKSREKS